MCLKYNNIISINNIIMLEPIVCVDESYGFSKDGKIPWHFSSDMKLFSDITKGVMDSNKKNICIMGRLTWENIPPKFRPLKDRINIIVSSTMECQNTDYVYFVKSIEDGMKLCLDMYLDKKVEHVFVCGGESLYDYALNSVLLKKIHITKINDDYNCDKFIDKDTLFTKCYNDMSQIREFEENNTKLSYLVFESHKKYFGEEQYLALLFDTLNTGHRRQTRNSVTYSKFGGSIMFDLNDGFPLLTTKKIAPRWIWEELMFFLSGKTDTNLLSDKGITIWQPNTTREFLDKCGFKNYDVGDMGGIYGFTLRHSGAKYIDMHHDYTNEGFDQVKYIIETLKNDPYSRRLIMSTFEASQAQTGVLYPCHGIVINFGIDGDNKLNCIMHQRSIDEVCGLPFNIASYAMLMHILVELVNNSDENNNKLKLGILTINFGDRHIYDQPDHIEAVKSQLIRKPFKFPELTFKEKINKLENMSWENIEISNYKSHPVIKVKMVA